MKSIKTNQFKISWYNFIICISILILINILSLYAYFKFKSSKHQCYSTIIDIGQHDESYNDDSSLNHTSVKKGKYHYYNYNISYKKTLYRIVPDGYTNYFSETITEKEYVIGSDTLRSITSDYCPNILEFSSPVFLFPNKDLGFLLINSTTPNAAINCGSVCNLEIYLYSYNYIKGLMLETDFSFDNDCVGGFQIEGIPYHCENKFVKSVKISENELVVERNDELYKDGIRTYVFNLETRTWNYTDE